MESQTEQVYVARQPILDREGRLIGFEMLFRAGAVATAEVTDDATATATVISNIFGTLGIDNVAGSHHVCFLNFDDIMLNEDIVELLPSTKVVIELLETIDVDENLVDRCRVLRDAGFVLALDDVVRIDDSIVPLLDVVEIVKVDLLTMTREEISALVEALRAWPVRLLAEKVETREQYEFCHGLGFDYFQGYFFAKPLVVVGNHLAPSEVALLRLLDLLMRDADISEIEAALKTQPDLVMQLLRMVNSASSGLRRTITSVRDAVVAVGRNQLARWLKLLLYAQTDMMDASSSPLLWMASQRARHMELMAEDVQPRLADSAFLVGIVSLLGALFNVPLEDVLTNLSLGDDVESALTERAGTLGALLDVAEAFELERVDLLADLGSLVPGLTLDIALEAQHRSIIWTNEHVTNLAD